MGDYRTAYWRESIESALASCDITVSDAYLDSLTSSLLTSAENEGMALGHDAIPNPLRDEVETLRRELMEAREREAQACREASDQEMLKLQWERRARRAEEEIEQRNWNRLLGR